MLLLQIIDFERHLPQDPQSQSIVSHMFVRNREKGSHVTQKIKKILRS